MLCNMLYNLQFLFLITDNFHFSVFISCRIGKERKEVKLHVIWVSIMDNLLKIIIFHKYIWFILTIVHFILNWFRNNIAGEGYPR